MAILAAIDIGANSVRLKIVETRGRSLRVIAEDREVTRLGGSVFRTGLLLPDSMDHTIRVLRRFQRSVRAHGVEALRVVATSPLRDAANAEEFIAWVYAAAGWKVEVISGLEEGRLIHLGVVSKLRLQATSLLLVDLGGGSCELTLSQRGHIVNMYSLPLGAVRLTGDFLQHDPPRAGELRRTRDFIREELARVLRDIRKARVEMMIGTSGTAAALAAGGRRGSGKRGALTSRAMVSRLLGKLAERKQSERAELPGIGTRRAEIIVAGALVFEELMEHGHIKAFHYSSLGLRDGLLAQMAADRDRGTLRQRIESDRRDAVLAMARHYEVDLAYAEQVQKLAMLLFTALKPVHQLPDAYREALSAAAMLHEVGAFINHAGRHRHARYVLANAEIFGYSLRQRLVMANLVRYLGKSQPSASDSALQAMGTAAAAGLPRAVALLRLARALNQGRKGAVRGLKARIRENQVELRISAGRAGAPLELWAVEKEAGYFRRAFGRALRVEVG